MGWYDGLTLYLPNKYSRPSAAKSWGSAMRRKRAIKQGDHVTPISPPPLQIKSSLGHRAGLKVQVQGSSYSISTLMKLTVFKWNNEYNNSNKQIPKHMFAARYMGIKERKTFLVSWKISLEVWGGVGGGGGNLQRFCQLQCSLDIMDITNYRRFKLHWLFHFKESLISVKTNFYIKCCKDNKKPRLICLELFLLTEYAKKKKNNKFSILIDGSREQHFPLPLCVFFVFWGKERVSGRICLPPQSNRLISIKDFRLYN